MLLFHADRGERLMMEAERRFRTLFLSSGEAALLTDGAGRVLLANRAMERLAHRSARQLRGASATELFSGSYNFV